MILFNDMLLIGSRKELDSFCDLMNEETYDDSSEEGVHILSQYLLDCFVASEQLMSMVQNKIGEDIIPITSVHFDIDNDMYDIDFLIAVKDEDSNDNFSEYNLTLNQQMLFERLCDICFEKVRPIFDRFNS